MIKNVASTCKLTAADRDRCIVCENRQSVNIFNSRILDSVRSIICAKRYASMATGQLGSYRRDVQRQLRIAADGACLACRECAVLNGQRGVVHQRVAAICDGRVDRIGTGESKAAEIKSDCLVIDILDADLICNRHILQQGEGEGDGLAAGALIGCGNCLSQGLVARRADLCHILIGGIHTIGILDLRIAVRKIYCLNHLVERAAGYFCRTFSSICCAYIPSR